MDEIKRIFHLILLECLNKAKHMACMRKSEMQIDQRVKREDATWEN
jgi:hypothetical protein